MNRTIEASLAQVVELDDFEIFVTVTLEDERTYRVVVGSDRDDDVVERLHVGTSFVAELTKLGRSFRIRLLAIEEGAVKLRITEGA